MNKNPYFPCTDHEFGHRVEEPLDLWVGGGLAEQEVSVALEDHVFEAREQLLVDPDADRCRIHLDAWKGEGKVIERRASGRAGPIITIT